MGYKLFVHPPTSSLRIRALQASVAVVSVTLVLFFASGMYEEKIKYAYSSPSLAKPFLGAQGQSQRKVSGTPNVMATIPPSSNPRGELIFSSRVDKGFREGYERYRAAFERRREEKAREEARRNGHARWLTWARRRDSPSPVGWRGTPTPPISRRETPPPGLGPISGVRRSPSPGESGLRHSSRPIFGDKEGSERSESYSFVLDQGRTGTGK
ncbi:uncharacterized protein IL334_007453 [Kwoniella shivajii]|uniref:Transmembrane protein 188 n=1 Tax=Kwoniella shivajii TaxID=564305 RepID=A0ABZ1D979_9TREE|nr:hypothetical protein IL334_007453 [Kwoniella shivajii]